MFNIQEKERKKACIMRSSAARITKTFVYNKRCLPVTVPSLKASFPQSFVPVVNRTPGAVNNPDQQLRAKKPIPAKPTLEIIHTTALRPVDDLIFDPDGFHEPNQLGRGGFQWAYDVTLLEEEGVAGGHTISQGNAFDQTIYTCYTEAACDAMLWSYDSWITREPCFSKAIQGAGGMEVMQQQREEWIAAGHVRTDRTMQILMTRKGEGRMERADANGEALRNYGFDLVLDSSSQQSLEDGLRHLMEEHNVRRIFLNCGFGMARRFLQYGLISQFGFSMFTEPMSNLAQDREQWLKWGPYMKMVCFGESIFLNRIKLRQLVHFPDSSKGKSIFNEFYFGVYSCETSCDFIA